tara:strand:- start:859 stop:1101 length:243 start_codon:yes stop_codon:yes gene_type:complete
MDIDQNIRLYWPKRNEEMKQKHKDTLRLTMLHLMQRLDYMQQLSYIEYVLHKPISFRHFEATIKTLGLRPCLGTCRTITD